MLEIRDLLAGDMFEPNDTFSQSRDLQWGDQYHQELSIESAGAEDWYRWRPSNSGTAAVSVYFTHREGNIDLEVFDASRVLIGRSTSLTDSETVSWPVTWSGTYFVRVIGKGAISNDDYDLYLNAPGTDTPIDTLDRPYPHPSTTATDLGQGSQQHKSLRIGGHDFPDEEFPWWDYEDAYVWTAETNGLLEVDLSFRHSLGNVNVEVKEAVSDVAAINRGVAVWDRAQGQGYIMYSGQNVNTRFAGLKPPVNGRYQNSDHFIAVQYISGRWYYNNNAPDDGRTSDDRDGAFDGFVSFTPRSTDVLVARVDFTADTIWMLNRQNSTDHGIALGYQYGDLKGQANWWNGAGNDGEFTVTGSWFTRNGGTVWASNSSANTEHVEVQVTADHRYQILASVFCDDCSGISPGYDLRIKETRPEIRVVPTTGLVTSESGGTARFNIGLDTPPTSDVTIGLSSSDTSEGLVSPSSVTFTPSNWRTPQSVVVRGVDDQIDDGDVSYVIMTQQAVSRDPGYSGLNAQDLVFRNTDDDVLQGGPLFENQTLEIAENSAWPTAVGTLSATDPAGGSVHFQIMGGNTNGAFALDVFDPGLLRVANRDALDFETNPTFTLAVRATAIDSGLLGTNATVTVMLTDVNEEPRLENHVFFVAEKRANGTVVGRLAGTDPDAGQKQLLNYSIVSGNTDGAFALNPSTGELTVANGAVLDHDLKPEYVLTVRAVDPGMPVKSTSAQVTIKVTEVVNWLTVNTTSDVLDADTTLVEGLVQNPGPDGLISLREAITATNNSRNGDRPDEIRFNIPGAGPHIIYVGANGLPAITDTVVIDGRSEPDFRGSPVLVLDGRAAGQVDGIQLMGDSHGSVIRGLAILGFGGNGIEIDNTHRHSIVGNYLGADLAGGLVGNLGSGVRIQGNASDNRIGGMATADGNLIARNDVGVSVDGEEAVRNTIRGNRFVGNVSMPIDLGPPGATLNDPSDRDRGANKLQNYADVRQAVTDASGDNTDVLYVLSSWPSSSAYPITVDFYQVSAGANPELRSVGTHTQQSYSDKEVTVSLGFGLGIGQSIVALATDSAGNSSEFSHPAEVLAHIPVDARDRGRGDNRFQDATDLGNLCRVPPAPITGSIDEFHDQDFFTFTVDCRGTLTAELTFDSTLGDLELELYEQQGDRTKLLLTSTGKGDMERISLAVLANPKESRRFFVKVFGFQGDANPAYTLRLSMEARDRDLDGLLDQWEEAQGILDEKGNVLVALPGADPDHKDLFVEVDYMAGFRPAPLPSASWLHSEYPGSPDGTRLPEGIVPTGTVLDMVVQAFGEAPNVYNPDGSTGIRLHVLIDDSEHTGSPTPLASKTFKKWNDFVKVRDARFGSASERNQANGLAVLHAKRNAYRYSLFGNQLEDTDHYGRAAISSNDFVVTLGGLKPGDSEVPVAITQAAVFMHELGHTLGLDHGGGNDVNFKPNYVSVMNYMWLLPGPETDGWRLDYSRYELPPLDRRALDESQGIVCGGEAANYYAGMQVAIPTTFSPGELEYRKVPMSCPVDWNGDGRYGGLVKMDITRWNGDASADGWPLQENDENYGGDPLLGQADWSNLRFQFTYSDLVKFSDVKEIILTGWEGVGPDEKKPSVTVDWDWFDLQEFPYGGNDSIEFPAWLDKPPPPQLDVYCILYGVDCDDTAVRMSIHAPYHDPDEDWFKIVPPFSGTLHLALSIPDGVSGPSGGMGLGMQVFDYDLATGEGTLLHETDEGVKDDISADVAVIPVDRSQDIRFRVYGIEGASGLYDLSFRLDVNRDKRNIGVLTTAMHNQQHQVALDLEPDGVLNERDLTKLVTSIMRTHVGDANLDGEFNSADFVEAFAAGKYETEQTAGWAEGDWNGDGFFDSNDFVIAFVDGGYELGPKAVAAAVASMDTHPRVLPEPILIGDTVSKREHARLVADAILTDLGSELTAGASKTPNGAPKRLLRDSTGQWKMMGDRRSEAAELVTTTGELQPPGVIDRLRGPRFRTQVVSELDLPMTLRGVLVAPSCRRSVDSLDAVFAELGRHFGDGTMGFDL